MGIIIPTDQLSQEALYSIIVEFITREGTDYGIKEYSLETKVKQVNEQLESEKAVLVYNEEDGTCNIVLADDPTVTTFTK